MIDPCKIDRIFEDIIEADVLDDRREYAVEDFMSSYDLTREEAAALYYRIQTIFYGRF